MLTTRQVVVADAALITEHRAAMFTEIDPGRAAGVEEMRRNFLPWVERMIASRKYVGWIVEDDQRPIASGGFFELEWPPHPLDPTAEHRGYLANFWVEPAYRGRGLARELVREGMAEAKRRKIRVVALHASDAGRRVYEPMGFRATNEMFYVDDATN